MTAAAAAGALARSRSAMVRRRGRDRRVDSKYPDTMPSRGRRTTLVVVCVVLTILLVVGGGAWSEIATAYHLWKLRTEPRFFEQLVDAPEESLRGMAMRRFAEDPSGAEVLLATLQREMATWEEDLLALLSGGHSRDAVERNRRSLEREYRFSYEPAKSAWTWSWSKGSLDLFHDTRTASRITRWLRFADGTELASSDKRPRTFRVRVEGDKDTEGWRVEIVVRRLADADALE